MDERLAAVAVDSDAVEWMDVAVEGRSQRRDRKIRAQAAFAGPRQLALVSEPGTAELDA